MALLAADVNISFVGPVTIAPLVANIADTYFQGSLVSSVAAGNVTCVSATAQSPMGISPKQQVVAAGGLVEVVVSGLVWMPLGSAITIADEGDILVYDTSAATTSDNPADTVSGLDITAATGDGIWGRIIRCTSTQMLIEFGSLTGTQWSTLGGWLGGL